MREVESANKLVNHTVTQGHEHVRDQSESCRQKKSSLVSVKQLINYRQFILGVICLILGVLVYVAARPAGALFLPHTFTLGHLFSASLVHLTGPLPAFFHVLGMSLLSAAILAPQKRGIVAICLAWAAINGLFELGQQASVTAWFVTQLPTGFHDIWPLEQILDYFHYGTFDTADLLAILLAAVIAYPIICHTPQSRDI